MSFEWTPFREDTFLDMVLPCNNEMDYQRILVKFGEAYNRNPEVSLREGDQWLRRRSNRRSDYTPNLDATARRWRRDGHDWSWVEQRVLDWALQKDNSESKAEVTVEYLAGLLQRTPEEVDNEIKRRSTEKHGIKGFQL